MCATLANPVVSVQPWSHVQLCCVCTTLLCMYDSVVYVRPCCVCMTLLCMYHTGLMYDSVVYIRPCCVCVALVDPVVDMSPEHNLTSGV